MMPVAVSLQVAVRFLMILNLWKLHCNFFHYFFTVEVVGHIVEQTAIYSAQQCSENHSRLVTKIYNASLVSLYVHVVG